MSFGNLNGKAAIVTGAAQGMGKAIALQLAQSGADVAICDIKEDELKTACDELKKSTGKRIYMKQVDISKQNQVNEFVADVEKEFGKVDILVNNAGIHPLHPIEDISSDEWDLVFAVNIKAHFFFCKAVIPGMRKRKFGRIICISSEAGKNGGTVAALHYAASKGAVLSFVRNLAQQVGADGITVNALPVVFKPQWRQPRHPNKHKNSWIKVLSNGSALPMILPMQYVILQAKKRLSLPPKPWRLTEVRCEINILKNFLV